MKRLFSRRPTSKSRPQFIEPLEGRQLLSATTRISSVTADNRGEVILSVAGGLDASTVTKSGVQAYTAGPDGQLGTSDDVHLPASVRYSSSLNRITISAQVSADVAYRVRVVSSRVLDSQGRQLDGEFTGAGTQSGNGHTGGIFEFAATRDTSATPTARMYTSAGTISLTLFRSLKPLSVANFLSYANSGKYDNIFMTRNDVENGTPFVEQAGGLKINSSNQIVTVPVNSPVASENTTNGLISNTPYTVALALSGSDANSGTDQFYFNMTNNSFLDNANTTTGQPAFTVFATAANKSSEATLIAVSKKTTVDLGTSPDPSTGVSQVPVNRTGVTSANVNPSADLVVFRRVVVMNKVGAVA